MGIVEKLKEVLKGPEKKAEDRPSCTSCQAPVVIYRRDRNWYFCPSCRHLYTP
ncbi:MAG: hypothetical protein ACE5KY_04515 [Candidatus Tectimicrobiota bacterium]